jgi:hypothetical protein
MSSHSRRLAEVLRIAENTCRALKSDVNNSEYSRGLYNGFALLMSILIGREYKPIESNPEERTCQERQ